MNSKTRGFLDQATRNAEAIQDADQKNLALALVRCAAAVCEEISVNVGPLPPTLAKFEREFALSLQAT